MKGLLDIKAGKKTYVLGVLSILFGVSGYLTQQISQETAILSVITGLGLLTGRRAVSRIQ